MGECCSEDGLTMENEFVVNKFENWHHENAGFEIVQDFGES